jgi:hypothetical protein
MIFMFHFWAHFPLAGTSFVAHCSIMTELARMKRPERALSTFIWFEQSPRHALNDCRPYTRIVSLLSRHREHTGDALGIVDRMFDLHIKPDLVCFNTAIDAAGAKPSDEPPIVHH